MCLLDITTSMGSPIYAGPAAIFYYRQYNNTCPRRGGALVIQPISVQDQQRKRSHISSTFANSDPTIQDTTAQGPLTEYVDSK